MQIIPELKKILDKIESHTDTAYWLDSEMVKLQVTRQKLIDAKDVSPKGKEELKQINSTIKQFTDKCLVEIKIGESLFEELKKFG